jgi:hypothetical protein
MRKCPRKRQNEGEERQSPDEREGIEHTRYVTMAGEGHDNLRERNDGSNEKSCSQRVVFHRSERVPDGAAESEDRAPN